MSIKPSTCSPYSAFVLSVLGMQAAHMTILHHYGRFLRSRLDDFVASRTYDRSTCATRRHGTRHHEFTFSLIFSIAPVNTGHNAPEWDLITGTLTSIEASVLNLLHLLTNLAVRQRGDLLQVPTSHSRSSWAAEYDVTKSHRLMAISLLSLVRDDLHYLSHGSPQLTRNPPCRHLCSKLI